MYGSIATEKHPTGFDALAFFILPIPGFIRPLLTQHKGRRNTKLIIIINKAVL